MKNTKRILSTAVAAILLAGSLSVTSFAADTKTDTPKTPAVSVTNPIKTTKPAVTKDTVVTVAKAKPAPAVKSAPNAVKAPTVKVDAEVVGKLLGTLEYSGSSFSFTVPENTNGKDWNISIVKSVNKNGVVLNTQFLRDVNDKKNWKAGEYYNISTGVIDTADTSTTWLFTVTAPDKTVTNVNLADVVKEYQLIDSLKYADGKISFTVPANTASKDVFIHIDGSSKKGTQHFLEDEGYNFSYVAGKTYSFAVDADRYSDLATSGVTLLFKLGDGAELEVNLAKVIKEYQLVDSIKYANGKVSFKVPAGVDSKDLFIHISGSTAKGSVHFLDKEGTDYSFEAEKTYSFEVDKAEYAKNAGLEFETKLLDGSKTVKVDLAKIIIAK